MIGRTQVLPHRKGRLQGLLITCSVALGSQVVETHVEKTKTFLGLSGTALHVSLFIPSFKYMHLLRPENGFES